MVSSSSLYLGTITCLWRVRSHGSWRLIETATVFLPRVAFEIDPFGFRSRKQDTVLNFRHAEDSQVRLPSNSSIEHATQCRSIDDPSVNSESDGAPSVLVHNDQYRVRSQNHRFTSEQINA